MRKLTLTAIGMYIGILAAFSQDSTNYKSRKLNLDEVNFVSGYYHQDGDHSAVTGGVGTEKLSDFANTIDLKLSKFDRKSRKHIFGFELGIDHYTSASSDKIDPHSVSSASYSDTRIYPTLSWSVENAKKRTTVGLSTSFSSEYDYKSAGIGGVFSKTSKDQNRELTLRAQAYFDQWKVIYPVELRTNGQKSAGSSPRNLLSGSVNLSQVINRNLQVMLIAEPIYQSGLLATKYQRVYFTDGSVHSENLPDTRMKIPIGFRANYFAGNRFILRSFYRYYMDDWGVKAHTVEFETPIKITPSVSVSPVYRYYTQSAADYFSPYGIHHAGEAYYTSDYDLSKFSSQFFGGGIRIVPTNGIFGIQHISSAEIRGGHYSRSEGLSSNIVSLHLTFK